MSTQAHQRFLALFLEHYSLLFGYVVRQGVPAAEADEVVQEIAGVLWEKFADFTPGTSFRAWACTVARYEVLKRCDRQRRDTRILRLEPQALAEIEQLEAESGDLLELRRDLLRRCLERLGARARRLIQWHYSEGLSCAAMASRAGVSEGALRTRLCRVRKALETCITRLAREGGVAHG